MHARTQVDAQLRLQDLEAAPPTAAPDRVRVPFHMSLSLVIHT